VALANVPLEDALRSVSLRSSRRGVFAVVDRDSAVVSRNGRGRVGRLEVLTRGSAPENPGEFIAAHELETALDELRGRADIVIVDGPPLLLSGDGIVLSSKVDGMLVVARLNVLKQAQVDELWRILSSCPAAKLGVVITGAPAQGGYYYYRYDRRKIEEPQRQLAD
jgi:Mrp family chromosome partitioning ATPase